MTRTILAIAAIAILIAGVAALVTMAVVAAPWQDAGGGAWVMSPDDDSPLPTPTAEHHSYVPLVLRHGAGDISPELDTPTPTPTSTPTPTPTATSTATPTSTPTATPTATSTPTSTPTPTPTPTSTPTPLPVHVLPNHTHYVDGEGTLHVVGEVENGTADPVYRVGITVQLLSSDGRVVDSGDGVVPQQHLAAGERTCFHVVVADPVDWVSYAFEAPSYSSGAPPPALSIVNDSGMYVPAAGWYLLGGEVRNDHATRVNGVTAVSTLYDSAGDAVGCGGAYVLSIGLEPGETGLFELVFSGRDYGDVASYRVQADGEPE
jgi:hypothetical protein